MSVYLVRHAKAGERAGWDGPDDLRPLSKRGHGQADALAMLLEPLSIDRVVSSPSVRCRETVEPIAKARRLPVDLADELAEGAARTDSVRLVAKVAHEDTLLCTHGDVLGELLAHWRATGVALDGGGHDGHLPLKKAGTWVLTVEASDVVAGRYLPPPAS